MKLEFTLKTIIEEVKMCTVRITKITTYEVIKRRYTPRRQSPTSIHNIGMRIDKSDFRSESF